MAPSMPWALAATTRPDWQVTVIRDIPDSRPDASVADLSEPELVAASIAGMPGAFDLIVERHRRQVYQVCYRFVNNHEDASDLSQDVFIRAFRGLKNFKGQATLRTWFHRIAVNVCLNRVAVKQHATEPIEERHDLDAGAEPVSERVLRNERAAVVRRAVARLPAKQRAALVLRIYQDLSHQEIAEALGSTVGAVKANVFHALQNLKKMLPGELG